MQKYNTIREWLIAGSVDGTWEAKNIFKDVLIASGIDLDDGPVYDTDLEDGLPQNSYCFWSPQDDGENYFFQRSGKLVFTANVCRGDWEITSEAGTWEGQQDDFEKVS